MTAVPDGFTGAAVQWRPGGLTSEEAAAALARDGPNELPADAPTGITRRIASVLTEPMLLFLVAAGAVSIAVAETLDGVLLLSTTVVVIATSVFQEQRTENALRALRQLTSPAVTVIRDGARCSIPARELVAGDVMTVSEGNRIGADAEMFGDGAMTVDESALTGESVPVTKFPRGTDAARRLWSGTLVTSGRGTAVVTSTGTRSRIGAIGASLAGITQVRTPLQGEIRRLVRVVGSVGGVAAVAVAVTHSLTRGSWADGTIVGIATAMSLLPEEFPVVLTIFLALGAWRMSREKVLARRMAVVEALGSVTVVCTDKTGTLTTNTMTVAHVAPAHRNADPVRTAALAVPPDPFDPMDRAFVARATTDACMPPQVWRVMRTYPLAAGMFAFAQVWDAGDDGPLRVAVKGAPETVAALCDLSPSERAGFLEEVDTVAARGLRTIAVASAVHARNDELPGSHSGFPFVLDGLVALKDPLREGAHEAVAACRRAGVRTVMLTGDHPVTACAIAAEAGLDTMGGVTTGDDVSAADDAALARTAATVNVYARIDPTQKLRLVRALQSNGEVVAMTGDGVNDAPALRAADVGIAMGRRGTDVAREAAAMVITDDDFGSIVRGIARGRGIYDNLGKTTAYLIAVHALIFGMSLVPLASRDLPVVLLPLQIAMLELVVDPACSILFQMEPHDPALMERPPRPVGARMVGMRRAALAAAQGAGCLAAVAAVYAWTVSRGLPEESVRSVTFVTLSASNLLLILVNRSWRLTAVGG
ncbi:MAG: cation-translocating P-type ATPase, partial [Ilumatobacteraceae bacterium]